MNPFSEVVRAAGIISLAVAAIVASVVVTVVSVILQSAITPGLVGAIIFYVLIVFGGAPS